MVITRRVLIGTGAAVVGVAGFLTAAEITHHLDDVARTVGLDPKPEPDPAEDRIVRTAAADLAALVALVEATADQHSSLALGPFLVVGREQLAAVSGSTAATDIGAVADRPAAAVTALEAAYTRAAQARAAECQKASSPELVTVLASMSAGLAQCARAVRGLR